FLPHILLMCLDPGQPCERSEPDGEERERTEKNVRVVHPAPVRHLPRTIRPGILRRGLWRRAARFNDHDVTRPMDHDAEPQDRSPEEDIRMARMALDEGDLKHAAFHAACAIAADPSQTEWLALFDELIRRSPAPLEDLAPLGTDNFYAVVAMHAYILEK